MDRSVYMLAALTVAGCGLGTSICPEYSGIVGVGTRWEYSYGLDVATARQWREVVAMDETTGLVTIERGYDSLEDNEDDYARVAVREEYRCDGTGLWLLTEYRYDDEGSLSNTWDYHEPGYLQLPSILKLGITWSADFHLTAIGWDGAEVEVYETHECTAIGEESTSVQAGEYEAIEVEWNPGLMKPPQQWFAKGAGLILWGNLENPDSMELTSYSP